VQGRGDAPPLEGPCLGELLADLPQDRHIAGGPGDALLAAVGQREVANLIGHDLGLLS
jgi:hypothetical protein